MRSMNFFMTLACLHGWTEASCCPECGKGSMVIVLNAWSAGTSWNTCAGVKGFLFWYQRACLNLGHSHG